MESRKKLLKNRIEKRDKELIADYFKCDKEGWFVYSVRELAKKYNLSVPGVYLILRRNGIKVRS